MMPATPETTRTASARSGSLHLVVRHIMTLEQYLKSNCERQVIDHAIRAEIGKDGNPRFYIHPANVSGDTLDFVVTKNQLHPVYIWDAMQELADAHPITPELRAKLDADRAKAEMSNSVLCDESTQPAPRK